MAAKQPDGDVIDPEMAHVYRQMTGAQRLAIASGMYASARRMLTSHLRHEHPEWDAATLTTEVSRRLSHGAV